MPEPIDLVKAYLKETDLGEAKRIARLLYELLEGQLRLYVRSRVSPPDREDVLQNILISIFKSLPSFRGQTEKSFRAWYFQIAWRRCKDYYSEKSSNPLLPYPLDELLELEKDKTLRPLYLGLDNFSLTEEVIIQLKDALDFLEKAKPGCRQLLWDYYIVSLDYDEIAAMLEITYDAARQRIARCLGAGPDLLGGVYA